MGKEHITVERNEEAFLVYQEIMIDSYFVHNVVLIFLCQHKLTYPFSFPRQK